METLSNSDMFITSVILLLLMWGHIITKLNNIMGAIDDRLAEIETGVDEGVTEILAEIKKLKDETLTDAGRATLTRLEEKVTALRNISPPVEPPPPPPEP